MKYLVKLIILSIGLSCAADAAPVNVERLATAIFKAENPKHFPYGIIASHQLTEPEARRWCVNTINHQHRLWVAAGSPGDYISWLGNVYAPPNAKNDPQRSNRFWIKNVKAIYAVNRQ